MDFKVRVSSSLLNKMGWHIPGYDPEKEKQAYLEHKYHSNANVEAIEDAPHRHEEDLNHLSSTNDDGATTDSAHTFTSTPTEEDLSTSPYASLEENINGFPALDTAEGLLKRLNWKNEGEKQPMPTILEMITWEVRQRDDFHDETNQALYEELIDSEKENKYLSNMKDLSLFALQDAASTESIDKKRDQLLGTIPDAVWNNPPMTLSHCLKEHLAYLRGRGNVFAYQNCVHSQLLGDRVKHTRTL